MLNSIIRTIKKLGLVIDKKVSILVGFLLTSYLELNIVSFIFILIIVGLVKLVGKAFKGLSTLGSAIVLN